MKKLATLAGSLAKHPFIRSVVAVAGGTAFAQVITVAFAPVITRLYGPDSFGVLGTFLSVIAIAAPISALCYPIAIVLPKRDADAVQIQRLSMLLALSIAALSAIVLTLTWPILDTFGLSKFALFLPFLPVVLILSTAVQVSLEWLVRKGMFATISVVAVARALLMNAAWAAYGLVSATGTTLIAIATAGLGLQALLQALWGRKKPMASNPADAVVPSLRTIAREYKDFPLYRAPEVIFNAISENLPVLFLALVFGPAEAGFYTLSRAVLAMPITLIGQSVSQVFYPRFNAQAQMGGDLLSLFLKMVGALALIGFPIFVVVALVTPWAFSIVFGADWERAGQYTSILSLWLFFMFANRPCISATSVLKMQNIFFLHGAATLVSRGVALWVGWAIFHDDLWVISLFSAVSALSSIALIILVADRARQRRQGLGSDA